MEFYGIFLLLHKFWFGTVNVVDDYGLFIEG